MRELSEKTESLLTHLTNDEFVDRATALARSVQDIEALEDRQADTKAQMKAEMTSLESERGRLGLIVARKAELREVRVKLYAEDFSGIAIYVRADSGEEVRRRPLEDRERQPDLPLGVNA
jgi:hypothetical protein